MSQDDRGGLPPRVYVKHDWFSEGQPVVLRLYPEYSVKVPLFPLSPDTDSLLPEPLRTRLMAWQKDFDLNFRWDTGWRSEEARTRWAAEAVPLEAELREALEGKADLVVDLWPLNRH
jgi:hypothetical protein